MAGATLFAVWLLVVVAENRGKRLFIKNTGPCENGEVDVYGLTPARCWKVKRTC